MYIWVSKSARYSFPDNMSLNKTGCFRKKHRLFDDFLGSHPEIITMTCPNYYDEFKEASQ